MKKVLFLLLLNILLFGNENNFDDFLKTLKQTTKIATKKKLNANYAPGIITILRQEDLKRLGIKNVYEALQLVPSVDILMSFNGTKNIQTRGIGGITGSGKTKILINGIEQNNDESGIVHYNLPIYLIDRIEIIRGPASALYGEYAFNGVINIITKKNKNDIFFYNNKNSNLIGSNLNYKQKDLSINFNISYDNDKGDEPVVKNKTVETLKKEQDFIGLIKYKNFKFNAMYNKVKKGDFYGLTGDIPTKDDNINYIYDYKTFEILYNFKLKEGVNFIPKVGLQKYKYYSNTNVEIFIPFPPPGKTQKQPVIGTNNYKKQYIAGEFLYEANKNQIILGLKSSSAKETTNERDNILNKRDINSAYFHFNSKINKKFSLNLGVRYDKYDDKYNKKLDDATLPRIAAVYKINQNNIFKTQYAKAYRPPTFLEQNIDSEKIDTYELQHIYITNHKTFKATLFYSLVKNLIIKTGQKSWANKNQDIISKGIEFEYLQNFNDKFLINSNLSYTKAYEKDTKKDIGNYSRVLGNFIISYLPYSKFSSSLHIRYIGKKRRVSGDNRDDLKAKTIANLSFRYLPTNKNSFEILFGVKNIFNQTLYLPSEKNHNFDLIDKKRTYFIGVNYKF